MESYPQPPVLKTGQAFPKEREFDLNFGLPTSVFRLLPQYHRFLFFLEASDFRPFLGLTPSFL